MLLNEYFLDSEIFCPCCCAMPDRRSTEMLYALRIIYNNPIPINSGRRCKKHNKVVGGVEDSAHLKGAFDCRIPGYRHWIFIKLAMEVGFNGIGVAENYVHIDRHHQYPYVWTYNK